MRKVLKNLSIRSQLVISFLFSILVEAILYFIYIMLIKNTLFFANHPILAHILFLAPATILLLLFLIRVIDLITDPLVLIGRTINKFYEIDLNEVIEQSTNNDVLIINQKLFELQQKVLADIDLLKKKNDTILELIDQQKKNYDAKKKLIASVSHDIKTPLTVIQTTIYAIKDGLIEQKDLESEYSNLINEIDRTTKMLQSLINIYKVEGNFGQPVFSQVDVKKVVDNSINNLENLIAKYHHHLKLNYQAKPVIKADISQFERIIDNLIVNAVIHSPENNTIEICLYEDNDNYILDIINTGITIDEEKIKLIFEPFFIGDTNKTSIENKNNGLGLYVVNELAANNNIEVNVSNLDNACKFSLKFKKEEIKRRNK